MVGAHVVKDFSIGNTRIKIADDYCRRNAGEVEMILKRIAERAQWHFIVTASTENYETHTQD